MLIFSHFTFAPDSTPTPHPLINYHHHSSPPHAPLISHPTSSPPLPYSYHFVCDNSTTTQATPTVIISIASTPPYSHPAVIISHPQPSTSSITTIAKSASYYDALSYARWASIMIAIMRPFAYYLIT